MNDTASGPTVPQVPQEKPAKPRKRRRWLRRIGCAVVSLFLLLVVLRFALPFALPAIVAKVAKGYDLACTYERLHFSVLGGYVELWHLIVAPIEGGEPYVHLEYACVDVATTALLRGKIVVRRLEVDGLDVLVDRDEEGKIALLERIGKGAGEQPPEPPPDEEPEEKEEPGEFDLRVPIAIDALRAQHVHLRVRDASVSPPLDARFDVNVRLSDLGSDARPARFQLSVASSPLLDRLDVEGEARDGRRDLSAQLRVLVRGLHPRALEGHLASLGIRAAAESLSFDLHMDVGAETTEDAKAVKALFAVDGIRLGADGEEALALDRFVLAADEIRPGLARIGRVLLEGGRVHARRNELGGVRIAGLEIPAAAAGEPPAKHGPVDLSLSLDELSIRDLLLDPAVPDAPVLIAARASAPGIFRSIVLDGAAVPFAARKTFDATVKGDGIAPDALRPLLAEMGIESLLEDGKLACAIHAAVEPKDDGPILAEFEVKGVRFEDARELLAFGGIRISGLSLDPKTMAIVIDEIAGDGPRLDVLREASGAISVLGIRVAPGAGGGASAPASAPPPRLEGRPGPRGGRGRLARERDYTRRSGCRAEGPPRRSRSEGRAARARLDTRVARGARVRREDRRHGDGHREADRAAHRSRRPRRRDHRARRGAVPRRDGARADARGWKACPPFLRRCRPRRRDDRRIARGGGGLLPRRREGTRGRRRCPHRWC